MSLHDSLGGMRSIPQWFIWRLVWDGNEAKYLKTPCAQDGSAFRIDASLPSNWMRYESAAHAVGMLNALPQCADKTLQYALGFWLTADCGYWFFDLDKCTEAPGVMTTLAGQLVAAFPGALTEWSSSGKGAHVIGKVGAAIPPHRTKPPKELKRGMHPLELEFYHQGRGIAFGLSGVAHGSADTVHDAMVLQLLQHYFPPREENEDGEWDKPRADWRGPTDDDELIRRALNAKVSAEVAFGGKPGFAALWRGDCERGNESDMALAAHLAFWTGCDGPRIERLMRRSGLVREKWDTHRTYLRELTIQNACNGCSDVYREPERSTTAMTQMMGAPGGLSAVVMPSVSVEMRAKVEELLDCVTSCGTVYDMLEVVIPAIRSAQIPPALCERLVQAVNKQLDIWQNKLPIGKLRAMCCPPVIAGSGGGDDAPEWVHRHCYVQDGDYFLDMANGARKTPQGFNVEYARCMPIKDNGSRENAAEWCATRWNMRTVHRTAYRPDQGPYFDWDGLEYANEYNPASVPVPAEQYTEAGIAGITALQMHLFDMCGRRQEVFSALLYWLAHNVQRPGVKIRWAPVIKGTQGDGKSLLSNVLRAAMGYRNVGVTGNATLTNSGGFNDWAFGSALNIIEEIMLTGSDRYRLYNAMKEFISNDVVSINGKGTKSRKEYNITNHIAFTNHNDAVPLEVEDRRWFVIYTPWANLFDMRSYCGLTAEGWTARTQVIDHAWRNCAGELRAWFLSMPIAPDFDINGSAPLTGERMRMMASSQDDAESVARQLISDGAPGVSENVISSACLNHLLKIRAMTDGFEHPRTSALNHLLTRMGYSRLEKQIKWRGTAHIIWTRNGYFGDNEQIRSELDNSRPTLDQLST